MPTLFLRFAIILEDGISKISPIHGPLFHRWLPDGSKDAITLDTGNRNSTLKVWFNRRGYVDGNRITFDYKRKDVDANVMNRQAVLDAGPLWGQLAIDGMNDCVEVVRI